MVRASRPVLIVDDDAGFRDSLQRALRGLSYQVDTAAVADDALRSLEDGGHRIVLLDMKLEGTSGLDVLKKIQSLHDDTLVILMTGFSELEQDMQSGLTLGAASSLTKPFDVDFLVAEIQRQTEANGAV